MNPKIQKFINYLRGKSIHVVGTTGAEGSSILRFLLKHHLRNITAHDFIDNNSIEKNFKLWHKGLKIKARNKLFQEFISDLSKITFYSDKNYLKNILTADIIFVPQSWRLYKQNLPLQAAKKQNIPFYSLTRMYLELAQAQVIGVTGTVGKGSVAHIIVQLLRKSGKTVYFAGNETWMVQIAEKLEEMKKENFLVLEISHRQLLDNIVQPPHIVVFTNLYPNHLDEVSWKKYQLVKLSLVKKQKKNDISVLNYDVPILRQVAKKLKSKIVFYSEKEKILNTNNIQKIFENIMNTKNIHYPINILAGATTINLLGVGIEQTRKSLPILSGLPARIEHLTVISEINFYDDIKSTTPWATIAAINKFSSPIILICGGRTKGINYQDFISEAIKKIKLIIFLKSQLSCLIIPHLYKDKYKTVDNLEKAIKLAYKNAIPSDNIIVSPAAGFFYTDFIKGKISLRRLVTSLPPKEQLLQD